MTTPIKPSEIDFAETLIAHLLCADTDDIRGNFESVSKRAKGAACAIGIPAESLLKFDPMRPATSYAFDVNINRLFALNSEDLLAPAFEILGSEAEVALLTQDKCVWFGARRIRKAPRGMCIVGRADAIYEVHNRVITPDGRCEYTMGVGALSANGKPLPCIFPNGIGSGGADDSTNLILAASCIEDTGRTGHFTTTVQDSASIIFPVPYGSQMELFKLRDGPMTPGGRKKAILHWVSKHIRNRGRNNESAVREHVRGVHSFSLDGLKISLEPNDEI